MQEKLQIGFISLGCSKNQVDTEVMMGIIKKSGHKIVSRLEEADIVIINTCGFITSAQEEGIDQILETAEYKKYGKLKRIIATGCLSQRFGEELMSEIPELDGCVGISGFLDIAEIVEKVWYGERIIHVFPPPKEFIEKGERIISTPPGFAYLKVSEGCSMHCSYCAIPNIRGALRSRSISELVEEAKSLVKKGIKEIILIGQDTAAYGKDLHDGTNLAILMRELEKIDGLEWIRLLYLHPHSITMEIIKEVKRNSKVVPYLDIPLQHVNNRILKAMHRPESDKEIRSLIATLREEIPDLTLRTTLMVGFPGETNTEFEELLEFNRSMNFDWMGSFIFEPQEGTKANDLPERVEDTIGQKRQEKLMLIQQQITRHCNEKRIGKTYPVLITGKSGKRVFVGHAEFQTPGVDGLTLIASDETLMLGTIVQVTMRAIRDYDMIGEISR